MPLVFWFGEFKRCALCWRRGFRAVYDPVFCSGCAFHWYVGMLCFVSYVFLSSFYSCSLISLWGVCRIIIFPIVLYGCETWSLTLWEEHRLTVFENRMLRRMFGQKRGEVIGGCRKLHNEKLHNLHSSPMRSTRHVAWMGITRVHSGFQWESQKESRH
jgi:hypothetical protein